MSRSRVRCPSCREQIGWLRPNGELRTFGAVGSVTTRQDGETHVDYVCPHCGHRWTWEQRKEAA